jgi:hypothetical protein
VEELSRGAGAAEPFSCKFVESKGSIWASSALLGLPLIESLFFSDRAGRWSFSVNRASSSCRLAIRPLSLSRRVFHSSAELQIVPRASNIEKFIATRVGGRVRKQRSD